MSTCSNARLARQTVSEESPLYDNSASNSAPCMISPPKWDEAGEQCIEIPPYFVEQAPAQHKVPTCTKRDCAAEIIECFSREICFRCGSSKNNDRAEIATGSPFPLSARPPHCALHTMATRLVQTASRPPPIWFPDCQVTLQEVFIVKGLLWSWKFNCEWEDCIWHICRQEFKSCKSYQWAVSRHLEGHVAGDTICKWKSCDKACVKGTKRNRLRHLTSHLAYYTICLRCISLCARRDARSKQNPCSKGTCRPAVTIPEDGLEEARRRFWDSRGRLKGSCLLSEVLETIFHRGPS